MYDPTQKVEALAQSFCAALGEKWEDMPELRKMAYRKLTFGVYESTLNVRKTGMEDAVDLIIDMMADERTPAYWMPGLKNALNVMNDRIDSEVSEEVGVKVPDSLSEDFDSADPYMHVEAGVLDPYSASEGLCEAQHEHGWSCTRPDHPPHWQHWDADRDVEASEVLDVGYIHVTWDSSGEITSRCPKLADATDD